jgi:hypothetical protein
VSTLLGRKEAVVVIHGSMGREERMKAQESFKHDPDLFAIGKFILGLYLGSGAAGSAYGAASSLITLLLWIFYSAQILLFGAEFTQVYSNTYGSRVKPQDHAIMVERREIEVPTNGEIDEPI